MSEAVQPRQPARLLTGAELFALYTNGNYTGGPAWDRAIQLEFARINNIPLKTEKQRS